MQFKTDNFADIQEKAPCRVLPASLSQFVAVEVETFSKSYYTTRNPQ